jgi:hypothetical protein
MCQHGHTSSEAIPKKNSEDLNFSRHVSARFSHLSTAEAFSIFSDWFAGPFALTSGRSPVRTVTTSRQVEGVVYANVSGIGFYAELNRAWEESILSGGPACLQTETH